MSDIKYIQNITAVNQGTTAYNFTFPVSLGFVPDMVIVRNITYVATSANTGALVTANSSVFLVWSDLINGYIGSYCYFFLNSNTVNTVVGSMSSPQRMLKPGQFTNSIQFRICKVNGTTASEDSTQTGTLTVEMDFIKYYDRKKISN